MKFIEVTQSGGNNSMVNVDDISRVSEVRNGRCLIVFKGGLSIEVRDSYDQVIKKMSEVIR